MLRGGRRSKRGAPSPRRLAEICARHRGRGRTPCPRRRCVIGIAGGSGSGKTTFARRAIAESAKAGIRGVILSLDNYYKPLERMSLKERKDFNFDHPDAIDIGLAVEHLRRLCAGHAVRQPVYDFKTYSRAGKTVLLSPAPLLIVEGLYALRPPELLSLYDYRVFVSTGIATAVLRRMSRDIDERGRDVAGARHQILTTVLPMYERYVKPTQRNAHFSILWEGEHVPEKATQGLVRMVRDFFRKK